MAKAPVPGQAKTRLMPALTADEAAALGAAFLRDITHNIAAAAVHAPIDGWVAYAPAGSDHLLKDCTAPGTAFLLADGAIELPGRVQGFGRSLLHAMQGLVGRGYAAACLVNSDSPTLPTNLLTEAASLLLEEPERIVLGPAEDGGYYLIGMSTPHAGLFEDIAWSTSSVAAQTRARAAALGLKLVNLEPWYDVDQPALLERLVEELDTRSSGARPHYAAPATAACAHLLGLRERFRTAK